MSPKTVSATVENNFFLGLNIAVVLEHGKVRKFGVQAKVMVMRFHNFHYKQALLFRRKKPFI